MPSNNLDRKRKRQDFEGPATTKPTAIFHPTKPRTHTLSVALPSSIISNAQSHDLKTALAGQIARALAVFCVDEVVIFSDTPASTSVHPAPPKTFHRHESNSQESYDDIYTGDNYPTLFLARLLSYLETPPHLRRQLFPMHPDLDRAGRLPSLDMPHHVRPHEWSPYREGVTVGADYRPRQEQDAKPPRKSGKKKASPEELTHKIEVGFSEPVHVEDPIPPNTRVTIKFDPPRAPYGFYSTKNVEGVKAEAVAPSAPREESGYYWGYSVRTADSLSAVLTECEFEGGYDVTIGTSERGKPLREVIGFKAPEENRRVLREYNHLLLVFGGVGGLEVAVKNDAELEKMGVKSPDGLFDFWVDLCPGQGSRTIRTEEAVWLGLMGLRDVVTEREDA